MRLTRWAAPVFLVLVGAAHARGAIGPDPVPSAPAAERRAAIEAVMRRMEAATLEGDAKAYMLLVDPSDAVFHKEQFNLAKDWAKNKAEAFRLSIVERKDEPVAAPAKPDAEKPQAETKEPPPGDEKKGTAAKPKEPEKERAGEDVVGTGVVDPVFDEGRAEFRMTTAWKMPGWKAERTLTMPVTFVRDPSSGAWLYAGEKWEAVVIPANAATGYNGVRILYEPGNTRLKKVADLVAKVMPDVRSRVDEHFKLKVPGAVTVKLYRSMRHLQASIWLSYTDGLGGWNEPGESIKILPGARSSEDGLKHLLGHEYGHCATFTMGPHATDAAWWVLEGSADLASSLFSKNPARSRDNQVREWMKNGKIADWEKLVPFPLPKEDEHLQRHVYVQGEHVLAFIATRYGDDARVLFVRRICEGKSTDEASREAIGAPWAEVDAAWRHAIQQQLNTEPKDEN